MPNHHFPLGEYAARVTDVAELRRVLELKNARRILAEQQVTEARIVEESNGHVTTVEAIERLVREIDEEPWKAAARILNLEAEVKDLRAMVERIAYEAGCARNGC